MKNLHRKSDEMPPTSFTEDFITWVPSGPVSVNLPYDGKIYKIINKGNEDMIVSGGGAGYQTIIKPGKSKTFKPTKRKKLFGF